jgi:hypothetical protein
MTDLLEQHFSRLRNPIDDSDWLAVRRRARRRGRRAALIAAVLVAAALLVAPAFGIGRVLDLIQGRPAPPGVKTTFAASNTLREQLLAHEGAAGRQLRDRYSRVIPSEARGVAAIESADGPIYLWAAPTEDGGQCWLIQAGGDPATGRPHGFGSCDDPDRTGAIRPSGPAWTIERPSIAIMHVRIYDDAITRVQIEFEDAADVSLPVVSGHALGTVSKEARLQAIAGRSEDGEVVARWMPPR